MTSEYDASWEPSTSAPTGESPLRHFKGRLAEVKHEDRSPEGANWTVREITFNFTELEVLEAIEVYPFETAQIVIRYADPSRSRGGTAWAAFSSSCRELMGAAPVSTLVGKWQEWKYMPATLRQRSEEGVWSDQPGQAWKVIAAEGLGEDTGGGAKETTAAILELLDGKEEKAFYEALFKDPVLRARSDVVSAASERTLLKDLKEEGLATVDDQGIWHNAAGIEKA